MADDVVRELRHPNLTGRKFSAGHQPAPEARGFYKVRGIVLDVFDRLGAEAELLRLARGTIEEKKIFWGIFRDCIPKEVAVTGDQTLIVRVVTQLGSSDVAVKVPKDAVPSLALPAAAAGRAPEEPVGA